MPLGFSSWVGQILHRRFFPFPVWKVKASVWEANSGEDSRGSQHSNPKSHLIPPSTFNVPGCPLPQRHLVLPKKIHFKFPICQVAESTVGKSEGEAGICFLNRFETILLISVPCPSSSPLSKLWNATTVRAL